MSSRMYIIFVDTTTLDAHFNQRDVSETKVKEALAVLSDAIIADSKNPQVTICLLHLKECMILTCKITAYIYSTWNHGFNS